MPRSVAFCVVALVGAAGMGCRDALPPGPLTPMGPPGFAPGGEIKLAWSPVGGRVAILAWPIFPVTGRDSRDLWIADDDGTDAVLIRTGVVSRVT